MVMHLMQPNKSICWHCLNNNLMNNKNHIQLKKMHRRKSALVLWFSAFALIFTINAFAQTGSRPNILIIMTDQQTADAMSNAGNEDLHTPAMDKLAANGVRFTKAYCAQPLCTPSRTAIFSGKMPFETGFIGNAEEKDGQWPDSLLMMGKIFQQAGYKTGYVGKWHLPVPTKKISSDNKITAVIFKNFFIKMFFYRR